MNWLDFTDPEVSTAAWTIVLGMLVNVSCALIGCYLVLRRQSLLGDAISHAVLPGIVLAFLISGRTTSWPMLLGALAVGMLTGVLTQLLQSLGNVPEDASMGVVFTSLFALGVVLLSNFAGQVHLDADCVLYGEIGLAATDTVPWLGWEVPRSTGPLGLMLFVSLAFVLLFWKELKLISFDPIFARSQGPAAGVVHYLLMGMAAAVTVASFEAVGSILVVAMLIVPAATAQLLAERLRSMLLWASGVGMMSAVLGYLSARWLNTTVAGMMAVSAGLQFTLAVFLAPKQGLVSKVWRQAALSVRIASEDLLAGLFRKEEGKSSPGPGQIVRGWDRILNYVAQRRLLRAGQVVPVTAGLALTERGRSEAQSLVRSHRLWESYLGEHFQLPLDHLHEVAERIEHYIGPELQERLATELASPGRDPHGREIPPPTGV